MNAKLKKALLWVAIATTLLAVIILLSKILPNLGKHTCISDGNSEIKTLYDATCRREGSYKITPICRICKRKMYSSTHETAPLKHSMKDGFCTECGGIESSPGLEFRLNDDASSYTLMGLGSFSGDTLAVDIHDGLTVTGIDESAFDQSLNVKQVIIGEKTSFGIVFSENKNITSVTIAGSRSIQEAAFFACDILESVKFAVNAKAATIEENQSADEEPWIQIQAKAFLGCNALSEIKLSERTTVIGDKAFAACASLKSINIPKALKSFGEDVFLYCNSLETVYYNSDQGIAAKIINLNSVKNLFWNATLSEEKAKYNDNIESAFLTGADTYIGHSLYGWKKLKSLSLVGEYALTHIDYCKSIESISVSAKSAYLDVMSCESLSSLTFEDGVRDFGLELAYLHLDEVYVAESVEYMYFAIAEAETSIGRITLENTDGWYERIGNDEYRALPKELVNDPVALAEYIAERGEVILERVK